MTIMMIDHGAGKPMSKIDTNLSITKCQRWSIAASKTSAVPGVQLFFKSGKGCHFVKWVGNLTTQGTQEMV